MPKKLRDASQINWEDIRLFLTIAECKSLRQAAKQLNIHHSTVARRLYGFEGTLKQELITIDQYNYTSCELTSTGKQISALAKEVSEAINKILIFKSC